MLQSLANGRNRSRSPGTRWEADGVAMAILDSTGTVRWQKEGCSIHDRVVLDVIMMVLAIHIPAGGTNTNVCNEKMVRRMCA